MTSEQIQERIAELDQQIMEKRQELAELLGIEESEMDIAELDLSQYDEEMAAQAEALITEINSLLMKIEALQEQLSNATATENFTGGEF